MKKKSATKILSAMHQEIKRSKNLLQAPGHPKPYFISYLVRDTDHYTVWSTYGAIGHNQREHQRSCFPDIRVGSFTYDQVTKGGLTNPDDDSDGNSLFDLPIEDDQDALQFSLWRLTDSAYRESVKNFHRRKSRDVSYLDENRAFPSFQKQRSRKSFSKLATLAIDRDKWETYVRQASKIFKRFPEIKNSSVEYNGTLHTKFFVSSEGSEHVWQESFHSLTAYAWFHTKKSNEEATIVFNTRLPKELPTLGEFTRRILSRIEKLYLVDSGSPMTSYSGPVLLAPRPAGLFIHEVVGHRLEGSRLLSDEEGKTLKDKVGKKIMHPDLSIYDDPTLESWQGQSLLGHFQIDDEGSVSKKVKLVENGVLKNFLTTRIPLKTKGHLNNGHARNQRYERPISRMGNLMIESRSSLSWQQLKKKLLTLVHEQGLPFGMILLEVEGGETGTEAYNFQAFLGEVTLALKIFPDGREEYVKGVDFVGTPLAALSHIAAVGSQRELDNGFCGAESGTVPVSTIAPAMLLSTLELQAKDTSKVTQYALPLPWFDS